MIQKTNGYSIFVYLRILRTFALLNLKAENFDLDTLLDTCFYSPRTSCKSRMKLELRISFIRAIAYSLIQLAQESSGLGTKSD